MLMLWSGGQTINDEKMNKIMLGDGRWSEDNRAGQCESIRRGETGAGFWMNLRYLVPTLVSDLASSLDRLLWLSP